MEVRTLWLGLVLGLTGCQQVLGLDDPLSGEPPGGGACGLAQTFSMSGTYVLPDGCSEFTVEAYGGGGAGGIRHSGDSAGDGGAGGFATARFSNQPAGATYVVTIGAGGACDSTAPTLGGYKGGGGGSSHGAGGMGEGAGPGGMGGSNPGAGGTGGAGGYGGGGGGGGGDTAKGNSGGGATTFQDADTMTFLVIAGGGGGAGAADQDGDRGADGGSACNGYTGMAGATASSSSRSGSGGGGGGCACEGGMCSSDPTPMGGLGGTGGGSSCGATQAGQAGHVVVRYP